MSIRLLARSSADPYQACHREVTEHPHYLDCGNCDYARYGACDYGRIYVRELWAEALTDDGAKERLRALGIDPGKMLDDAFLVE